MTKALEVTLTLENLLKVDKLISRKPDSDFQKSFLMNDIFKLGLDRFDEQITMNQQASQQRIKLE